jgi:hypothetical protein
MALLAQTMGINHLAESMGSPCWFIGTNYLKKSIKS